MRKFGKSLQSTKEMPGSGQITEGFIPLFVWFNDIAIVDALWPDSQLEKNTHTVARNYSGLGRLT